MKLSPKEQAKSLWTTHTFYWNDSELEAKQRIVREITQIIYALKSYGIEDNEYWIEVKKHIYEYDNNLSDKDSAT